MATNNKLLDSNALSAIKTYTDKSFIGTYIYEVDAVTRPTSNTNYVVYHITAPNIESLSDGLTVRVHKGLASSWPNDSSGAVKLLQINNLDPIAIFWRYNSFAAWNQMDNVNMTLTYSSAARPSTSDYYGYKSAAGFIMDFTYDSGNDVYNLYDYSGYKTGSTALTAYSIIGWDSNGNRIPLVQGDGTLTNLPFDYARGIQYWESAVAANTDRGPWTGNAWYPRITATITNAFISAFGFNTVTTADRFYLKCSMTGRAMTVVGVVKTLPTTNDGYYYMLIAKPYQNYTNSTGNQNWTFFIRQPIYSYSAFLGLVVPMEYKEAVQVDANAVHKTGDETIAGAKNFTSGVVIGSGSGTAGSLALRSGGGQWTFSQYQSGSTQYLKLDLSGSSYGTKSINFPSSSGTIALTSQIPSTSSFVNLTSAQTITGKKTFQNTGGISISDGSTTASIIESTAGADNDEAKLTLSSSWIDLGANGNANVNAGNINTDHIHFNQWDVDSGCVVDFPSTAMVFKFREGDATSNYGVKFPTTSSWTTNKTLATTDQIPSTSNFVDLTSNQSITGSKTFLSTVNLGNTSTAGQLNIINSYGPCMFYKVNNTGLCMSHSGYTSYTVNFPTTSGTLALTSNLPQIYDIRS